MSYSQKVKLNVKNPFNFVIIIGADQSLIRYKATNKITTFRGGAAFKKSNIPDRINNDNVMKYLSDKLRVNPLKKIIFSKYEKDNYFTKSLNNAIMNFVKQKNKIELSTKMVSLFSKEMCSGALGINQQGLRWGIKTGQLVNSLICDVSKKSNK